MFFILEMFGGVAVVHVQKGGRVSQKNRKQQQSGGRGGARSFQPQQQQLQPHLQYRSASQQPHHTRPGSQQYQQHQQQQNAGRGLGHNNLSDIQGFNDNRKKR